MDNNTTVVAKNESVVNSNFLLLLCAVYERFYVVIDVLIFEKSTVVNFQLLLALVILM